MIHSVSHALHLIDKLFITSIYKNQLLFGWQCILHKLLITIYFLYLQMLQLQQMKEIIVL